MKSGILTRISAGVKSQLRTNEVKGFFAVLPQEGESFTFYGDSLDVEGGVRVISTTPVKTMEFLLSGILFETVSGSQYELSVDPEIKA